MEAGNSGQEERRRVVATAATNTLDIDSTSAASGSGPGFGAGFAGPASRSGGSGVGPGNGNQEDYDEEESAFRFVGMSEGEDEDEQERLMLDRAHSSSGEKSWRHPLHLLVLLGMLSLIGWCYCVVRRSSVGQRDGSSNALGLFAKEEVVAPLRMDLDTNWKAGFSPSCELCPTGACDRGWSEDRESPCVWFGPPMDRGSYHCRVDSCDDVPYIIFGQKRPLCWEHDRKFFYSLPEQDAPCSEKATST
eukprot:CAMPEP_0206602754 /NCGR_PEP_ID=MMETSP0325_2-20121206/47688_1 /ASSEMBLY_ACC=CAM_ASM_000347 /TAXON_ID=2866 /ORGANISM="Crypthecodinium cohnii, Strain Seligo" /LENGTH=247 /DNA_ID=CAMNT_0054115527 /DNA_START=79 /DNA_END=819 /DNA_ORIENTATION=+